MAPQHSLPLLLAATCVLMGCQLSVASQLNATSKQISSANPMSLVKVQTTSGILNGAKQALNVGTNSSVYKFLAVPYALPPTGQLRFRRPVELPKERQHSQVDASRHGATCPQFRHLARFISPLLNLDAEHQTSEDCLHLNVYVPSSVADLVEEHKLEPNKQVPVIVWIPGEGFDFADARQFDGSYLAQGTQSIVVTVQYRVGVLGFLDAPEAGIGGNMGIHDQLMALRWVHKNIGAFGGDAQRVTLMGRFSGAMTISTMLTAPQENLVKVLGQPLFKRAALLSGLAVEDWIIEENQAQKLGQVLESALRKGYCTKSQILNQTCLQTMPLERLLEISGFGWKLVVDNQLIGRGGPTAAVERNQILSGLEAILLGETSTEGTLCLYRHLLSPNNDYAQLIDQNRLTSESLNEIIQDDSLTYFKYNVTESNPMRMALEAIVAPQEAEPLQLRDKYLDACSSFMVKAHANRFKRNLQVRNLRAEKSFDKRPVELFHYELKYKPSFSLAPAYIKTAAHGDDIPLIFGLVHSLPKQHIDGADLLMTRKMMSYVGNFVHGNHPLLQQHSPVDVGGRTQANERDADATNLDESDEFGQAAERQAEAGDSAGPISHRRSSNWATDSGPAYPLDLDGSEQLASGRLGASRSKQQHGAPAFVDRRQVAPPDTGAGDELDAATDKERLQADDAAPQHRQVDPIERLKQASSLTRSQRLVELHNQQVQEQQQTQSASSDAFWLFNPRHNQLVVLPHLWADVVQSSITLSQSLGRNSPPTSFATVSSDQQALSSGAESANQQSGVIVSHASHPNGDPYLLSVLLIGACVVIFALTSFCIVLSMIVFRRNLIGFGRQRQRSEQSNIGPKKRLDISSSTCNICDDSQGNSMDNVLKVAANQDSCEHTNHQPAAKRVDHGFRNVFAKLSNHTGSQTAVSRNQDQAPTRRNLCQLDGQHLGANNQAQQVCRNHHLQVDTLIGAHKLGDNCHSEAQH